MRGTHTLYSRRRDAKKTGVRKVCHDDKLAEEAEAEAAAAAIDRRGGGFFVRVLAALSRRVESREKEDFLLQPSSLLRFFAPSYPPHPFPPASSHTEAGASDGGEGEYYAFHRGRRVIIVEHLLGCRKCFYGAYFRKPHALTYANLDKAVEFKEVEDIVAHTYVCVRLWRQC